MARASIPTLLALDRYAAIIGINPAHFNGAYGETGNSLPMPISDACAGIWMQYDWQANGKVSRESLAEEIAKAEEDIARTIGYWPAPVWRAEEVQQYPEYHRPEIITDPLNSQGLPLSVKAGYGRVIAGGQRATTQLCLAAVGYSDDDSDGYNEIASVSCRLAEGDTCDYKVYFEGHSGDPEWEIRPYRTRTHIAGTLTFTFWAWQLIQPALWEALPTENGMVGLNLGDTIYEANAEIRLEYNDTSKASSQFYWEPSCPSVSCACGGVGCSICSYTTQDGCMHVRDAMVGIIVPTPGEYNATTGVWDRVLFSKCGRPKFVKLWYYAGEISNEKLRGRTCDPLSNYWAQTIAWLATARLGRPICGCGAPQDYVKELQADMAFRSTGIGSFDTTQADLQSPFGTRVGEIRAWKRISKLVSHIMEVATL